MTSTASGEAADPGPAARGERDPDHHQHPGDRDGGERERDRGAELLADDRRDRAELLVRRPEVAHHEPAQVVEVLHELRPVQAELAMIGASSSGVRSWGCPARMFRMTVARSPGSSSCATNATVAAPQSTTTAEAARSATLPGERAAARRRPAGRRDVRCYSVRYAS